MPDTPHTADTRQTPSDRVALGAVVVLALPAIAVIAGLSLRIFLWAAGL